MITAIKTSLHFSIRQKIEDNLSEHSIRIFIRIFFLSKLKRRTYEEASLESGT